MKLAVCYLILGIIFEALTFTTAYEDVSCFGCQSLYVFHPISIIFAFIGLFFLVMSFKRVYTGTDFRPINEYNAKDLTNNSNHIDG